ncbi:MAG: prolyl oligopeptidase family serine peptidase [Bryobacterales bacterium]|nr:prolyl oligopeptidase family serine peptidase [Bryobacterales bacterium]
MRVPQLAARLAALVLVGCSCMLVTADGQIAYQKPPREILDVLHAKLPPMISVSPQKDRLLLMDRVAYPSIAELARPMKRLAGLRIDPANNGRHAPTIYTGITIRDIAPGGEDRAVALPHDVTIGEVTWSHGGQYFAFPWYRPGHVELWVVDVATAKARPIAGVALNQTVSAAIQWLPDGKTLLVLTVPTGRTAPPSPALVPAGPTIQQSDGAAAPVRTYQDLLEDSHDEDLFEYYATSQPVLIDAATGKVRPFLKKGIYSEITASPDGKHFLVERIHRPFSFLLPYYRFPLTAEVVDRRGRREYLIAEVPLQDKIPIEGVRTGPRSYTWTPWGGATLVWLEALDGGDPRVKASHRDKIVLLDAPFRTEPRDFLNVEQRFAGLTWLETENLALLRDYDRDKRWTRAFLVDLSKEDILGEPVFSRNIRDRYNDEGSPLRKMLPNGYAVAIHREGQLLLSGAGATPKGDRPFLDRFDLVAGRKQRLFQCGEGAFEFVVTALSDDGSSFITSKESPSVPPNLIVKGNGGAERAITKFKDPTPQLRGITKQIVKYERDDGTQLSFTLYLPPDYKQGTRLPAVVWAYPMEFSDPATAGQVSGSENRFTSIQSYSHLFFLLAGYAILDETAMPVVGPPETANDTFIRQIVDSAEAAIAKAAAMGVIDPARVAVGGHSYGAFMTANLLAHSRLFRAGIARSGAYNRTLTPFGFQAERRTYWEAPEIYYKLSPFSSANLIEDPILLIHGEADNNAGTFPIQSERLYQAIRGNGGLARLVMLPHESHGYRAKESIEHVLWESITWLDKYVKNAPPRDPAPAKRESH